MKPLPLHPTHLARTPYDTLHQIYVRLCFHFHGNTENTSARDFFINSLECYPEDLVCAAYFHFLKHHAVKTMPTADAFIRFIEPEYLHRINAYSHLLQQQQTISELCEA